MKSSYRMISEVQKCAPVRTSANSINLALPNEPLSTPGGNLLRKHNHWLGLRLKLSHTDPLRCRVRHICVCFLGSIGGLRLTNNRVCLPAFMTKVALKNYHTTVRFTTNDVLKLQHALTNNVRIFWPTRHNKERSNVLYQTPRATNEHQHSPIHVPNVTIIHHYVTLTFNTKHWHASTYSVLMFFIKHEAPPINTYTTYMHIPQDTNIYQYTSPQKNRLT